MKDCSLLHISWCKVGDRGWRKLQTQLHSENGAAPADALSLFNGDFNIGIIRANADKIRECDECRHYFTQAFGVPRFWWTSWCRRANGYVGCEETRDQKGDILSYRSWARFMTKILRDNQRDYEWYKLNVFTLWTETPRQTILIMFDTPPAIADSLQNLILQEIDTESLSDSLWIYSLIAEEIVRLQEHAVWGIRNQVRAIEKTRGPSHSSNPDFQHVHDIARHAIHVSETLDSSIKSMKCLVSHHEKLMLGGQTTKNWAMSRVHNRLLFHEHMLNSLRFRSTSNKERLVNEIQLAFNTVAQQDSHVSLQIGRAVQLDSTAMKTVAFVTLTFLPATFISAIFSMSFFNYDSDSGLWSVSDKFWLYWVVAVPTTAVTFLFWYVCQGRLSRGGSMEQGERNQSGGEKETHFLNKMLRAGRLPANRDLESMFERIT